MKKANKALKFLINLPSYLPNEIKEMTDPDSKRSLRIILERQPGIGEFQIIKPKNDSVPKFFVECLNKAEWESRILKLRASITNLEHGIYLSKDNLEAQRLFIEDLVDLASRKSGPGGYTLSETLINLSAKERKEVEAWWQKRFKKEERAIERSRRIAELKKSLYERLRRILEVARSPVERL